MSELTKMEYYADAVREISDLHIKLAQLTKERDELRKALKEARKYVDHSRIAELVDKALAATATEEWK